jgi:hypothetical protein
MDEYIDIYMDLSKEIFKIDQILIGYIPVDDNYYRFDYNILEKIIKNILKGKLRDEN